MLKEILRAVSDAIAFEREVARVNKSLPSIPRPWEHRRVRDAFLNLVCVIGFDLVWHGEKFNARTVTKRLDEIAANIRRKTHPEE